MNNIGLDSAGPPHVESFFRGFFPGCRAGFRVRLNLPEDPAIWCLSSARSLASSSPSSFLLLLKKSACKEKPCASSVTEDDFFPS